jgi:hypothetical protein
MTLPKALLANEFKPRVRIRYRGQIGRIVTAWLDGKWAVQLAHHPKGSYTILRTDQMTIIGKEPRVDAA